MQTIKNDALRLPAQYAMVEPQEGSCIDGGGTLGWNPFKWFDKISATVTVTWNGGALATQYPKLAWIFKQLALNLKFTLT